MGERPATRGASLRDIGPSCPCLIGFRSHVWTAVTPRGRHEEVTALPRFCSLTIALQRRAVITGRNLPVNDNVIMPPWERPRTHRDHESQIVISPPITRLYPYHELSIPRYAMASQYGIVWALRGSLRSLRRINVQTGKLELLTSTTGRVFGTVCLSKRPAADASFYTQRMAGDTPAPGCRALVKPRLRSNSTRQLENG